MGHCKNMIPFINFLLLVKLCLRHAHPRTIPIKAEFLTFSRTSKRMHYGTPFTKLLFHAVEPDNPRLCLCQHCCSWGFLGSTRDLTIQDWPMKLPHPCEHL